MRSCWNGSVRLTTEECNIIPGAQLAQFACIAPRAAQHAAPIVALPSIQKGMSAPAELFGVSRSRLIDTGCPKDLAPASCSEYHPASVCPSTSHTFETVAGAASTEAKMKIESYLLEGHAIACALDKAPPVLSVGAQ